MPTLPAPSWEAVGAEGRQPDVVRNRVSNELSDLLRPAGLVRGQVDGSVADRNGSLSQDTVWDRQLVLDVTTAGIADDGTCWCTRLILRPAQVIGDGLSHPFVAKNGSFVHALIGVVREPCVAETELFENDLVIGRFVRTGFIAHAPSIHFRVGEGEGQPLRGDPSH